MKFFACFSGIIVGVLAAGAVSSLALSLDKNEGELYSKTKIIGLDKIVGLEYFKESEMSDRVEGLYSGYVAALDNPNTMYLTIDEKNKYLKSQKGISQGVGIQFTWGITNQYLVITEVQPDSPASLAGIEVGDRIIKLDDILAMGSNEIDIYNKLTTTNPESILYTIQKPDGSITEIPLAISEILIPNVETEILDNDIEYIKPNKFKDWSIESDKAIIDLRYVSGSTLNEAFWLCDLFLDEGEEVFTTIDKYNTETLYKATPIKLEKEVVILTNNSTRGAIESAVARLKPLENIYIVGDETDGSGMASELIELVDGSALLIASKQISIDGQIVSTTEIEPEYDINQGEPYTLELVTTGKVNLAKDDQLQKAIEILN